MDIVRGVINNSRATESLIKELEKGDIDGTLYLGYPLRAMDELQTSLDAMLVSQTYGLIVFSFNLVDSENDRDELFYQIEYTFRKYPQLRNKRNLAFTPKVWTYTIETRDVTNEDESNPANIISKLESNKEELSDEVYRNLVSALQKVSTFKSVPIRNISRIDSKGAKIAKIEKAIANLDQWQKKAAFENPEGIQRIRGLAGSGKTVVLAIKAAYLHFQYPDWNIAVTFYTQSLAQQFKRMINAFYREYTDEGINEDRLHILHAWGNSTTEGIYSTICKNLGIIPETYNLALQRYGRGNEFSGIIDTVYNLINDDLEKYDAILIDEAQDMPANFFKLCYRLTKDSHKIVYAYDELQNLSTESMPNLGEMFGTRDDGTPIISLENESNKPLKDIMLPVCYRNTRWALTLAHSLGFGIYREQMVQFFNNSQLWTDIGYSIVDGSLEEKQKVSLRRSDDSSPEYFNELLDANDSIKVIPAFESSAQQYEWIAEQIERNITDDELNPEDIMVIFPDAYSSKKEYFKLIDYLERRNIGSNLAGITTQRDVFFMKDNITCSSIYRAKGNECAMVYIVNSNQCYSGSELIKKRNALFTAITRSKAWVTVCGVGEEMTGLFNEAQECINRDFKLNFTVPTDEEISKMRRVHRELTAEDKEAFDLIKKLKKLKSKGVLDDKLLHELSDLVE